MDHNLNVVVVHAKQIVCLNHLQPLRSPTILDLNCDSVISSHADLEDTHAFLLLYYHLGHLQLGVHGMSEVRLCRSFQSGL